MLDRHCVRCHGGEEGVGGGMDTLPSHQRKAPHEGIDGKRRVNVEVAKQDSVVLVGRRFFLASNSRDDVLRSQRNACNATIILLLGPAVHEPKSQDDQHQSKNDSKTTLFLPSHAGRSIEPNI